MVEDTQSNIWTEFRDLVQAQLSRFEKTVEKDDLLEQFLKDSECTRDRPHVEIRLISFCLLRLLQFTQYLVYYEEPDTLKMQNRFEEKEAIIQEIQTSLHTLNIRLYKYTTDVIMKNLIEKETTYESEKNNIADLIDTLFTNEMVKDEQCHTKEMLTTQFLSVCENAQDFGFSQGELTLSNDMNKMIDVVHLLTQAVQKQVFSFENFNQKSTNEMSPKRPIPCPYLESIDSNVLPLMHDTESSDLDTDWNEFYSGSEYSIAWSTARDVALRDKAVPKLNFDFIDSETERTPIQRKREKFKNGAPRTYFQEEAHQIQYPFEQITKNEKSDNKIENRTMSEYEDSTILFRPVQTKDQYSNDYDNPSFSSSMTSSVLNNNTEQRDEMRPHSSRSNMTSTSHISPVKGCRQGEVHQCCYRDFLIAMHPDNDKQGNPHHERHYPYPHLSHSCSRSSPTQPILSHYGECSPAQELPRHYGESSSNQQTSSDCSPNYFSNQYRVRSPNQPISSYCPNQKLACHCGECSSNQQSSGHCDQYSSNYDECYPSYLSPCRPNSTEFTDHDFHPETAHQMQRTVFQITEHSDIISRTRATLEKYRMEILLSMACMIVLAWLYLCHGNPLSRSVSKSLLRMELGTIWSIVDCINRIKEITHYGLPPL